MEPLEAADPIVVPVPPAWKGRAREWAKILSAYFTAQTLTQLLGIAAGILFIRFLPVREFALYTLATSIVTFFTFVSDLGSTSSLVHFYRVAAGQASPADQAADQPGEFRRYLAAVLSLRRTVFLLGGAAILAAFPLAARAKGFGLVEALPVALGIVACVWFQIGSSLRLLALRLESRYGLSYRAELAGASLRLATAAAMAATAVLWAWLAVATTAAGAALTGALARFRDGATAPAAARHGDLQPYRRKVLRYLLPTLPSAVYFSIQGPLVIWLSATFGSNRTIAEVGALARLSLIVGLFSNLTGIVFLPRLARVTDDRLYRRRYFQFGAFLVLVAASLLAAAALVPGWFLLILGPHYSGLHRELLLVVAGAGLNLLDGYAVGINAARSWNRWQAPALIGLFAVQASLIALLPLSTTWNVLLFNLFTATFAVAVQTTINLLGFRRPRWVEWA